MQEISAVQMMVGIAIFGHVVGVLVRPRVLGQVLLWILIAAGVVGIGAFVTGPIGYGSYLMVTILYAPVFFVVAWAALFLGRRLRASS